MSDIKTEYEELKDYNYFSDIFDFVRESTGIAITLSYLILILSSMTYLYVLYSSFDISIIKLLTLEDILATPIKNPNIILAFFIIVSIFYLQDKGNRLHARLNLKYIDTKTPFRIRLLKAVVWSPKKFKGSTKVISVMILFFLILYVLLFALQEARGIQRGSGSKIELQLADSDISKPVTLLGTTSQFLMVYDESLEQAGVYQIESVHSFKPLRKTESPAQ